LLVNNQAANLSNVWHSFYLTVIITEGWEEDLAVLVK